MHLCINHALKMCSIILWEKAFIAKYAFITKYALANRCHFVVYLTFTDKNVFKNMCYE